MLVRIRMKSGKNNGVKWGVILGSGGRKFNLEFFFK